ncbi:hypothetical protein DV735_g183, partial [Chaetothyriales sp. CBS 134920]
MNGLFTLLLWSLAIYQLYAFTPGQRKEPQGDLKVTLDYSLAMLTPVNERPGHPGVRSYMWSSHVTFNGDVSEISDGQLVQLGLDAYAEMMAEWGPYGIGKTHQPSVMGVLAWGHELIFASSQRGELLFAYNHQNTEVQAILRECGVVWRDTHAATQDQPHMRDGKCAEVMATQLYYMSRETPKPRLPDQSARVVAIQRYRGGLEVVPPCGTGRTFKDTWGCNEFVKNQNLRVLDNTATPAPYVLATLAGGTATIDQIQLCGSIRHFNS